MVRQQLKKIVPAALHPYLGSIRRRLASNALRTRRQKDALLRSDILRPDQKDLLRQVDSRIDPRDGMYTGNGNHYFLAGLSCLDCIEKVLNAAKKENVDQVLYLPSGYGRELRALVVRFPFAQLTACDIQRGGVDFCADRFGANSAYSDADPGTLTFERSFDLIWCGSLVTHFDLETTARLLRTFYASLSVGGVAIFTTHGDYVFERLKNNEANYDLSEEKVKDLVNKYSSKKYSYQDYQKGQGYFDFHPKETGYGVSLMSPSVVRKIAGQAGDFEEVYFEARGWAGHQDVFAFKRRS